ncbi:MAG TPA: TetR/AcrR family transcriptional regulator, partial [Candidatus Pristimantibacillus sp.]|nr:TetR/AcrR family transcriptional regulator [Candidatus Pristimantibacillus sp.]
RAGIPIGSLYRYYPNKDAITSALLELYIEGMTVVFDEVRRHPMLQKLSWGEVVALLVGGWMNYLRLNGPFNFLYITRVNPDPFGPILALWDRLYGSFGDVLRERCPDLTNDQVVVAFRLTYTAAEMGVDHGYQQEGFEELCQEAMAAATLYLENACNVAGEAAEKDTAA